jgi:hypothetical protein
MHEIEPFHKWEKYYVSNEDERSPFYQREYNFQLYTQEIYGYFIDPYWDYIGSETLYIKILFVDYVEQIAIIEFIGEWNDALHNDIMWLKREVVDNLTHNGINKFIMIGENILNFHGSDDEYYEEWFDDVEDGWIAAINFRDFVLEEWQNFNLDSYINFGGMLEIDDWRTMKPQKLYNIVNDMIVKRLG